jgi:hypothetical protein
VCERNREDEGRNAIWSKTGNRADGKKQEHKQPREGDKINTLNGQRQRPSHVTSSEAEYTPLHSLAMHAFPSPFLTRPYSEPDHPMH